MQTESSLHSYSRSIYVHIFSVVLALSYTRNLLSFYNLTVKLFRVLMGPVVLGTTSMTKRDQKNRKAWTVRDRLET